MDSRTAGQLGRDTVEQTAKVSAGLMLQYDRDQEYEADQIGLMIMGKAGYDPRVAVEFWNRASEIFGSSGGGSFLSTHPTADDRAEELEEALPVALKYYEAATSASQLAQATPATPKGAKKQQKKKAK